MSNSFSVYPFFPANGAHPTLLCLNNQTTLYTATLEPLSLDCACPMAETRQPNRKREMSRKVYRVSKLISIDSGSRNSSTYVGWAVDPTAESRASAQAKHIAFTEHRDVNLISLDSASSTPTQEEVPLIPDRTTDFSSRGSGGILLPTILTSNTPAQFPLLPPPLEPHRPLKPQQGPAATLNMPIGPPRKPDMPSIHGPGRNTLAPEPDLPEEPCVTMEVLIERHYLPLYLASQRPMPMHAQRKVKENFRQQAKAQHAELAVQVEGWRHKVATETHPRWMWNSSPAPPVVNVVGVESQRARRLARDRMDLTDFVNGRVQGVYRQRVMCWPILISAKAFAFWYQPGQGERPLDLHKTDSVERLDALRV
ncbi:MAG: hypothetical protein Q9206_004916 [Seirophora lacunosa]